MGLFKDRCIGHFCGKAVERNVKGLVSVSPGGNSALAAAHTGRAIGVPVHAVLPKNISGFVVRRLVDVGGVTVTLHGSSWRESEAFALELAEKEGLLYVPSYDHPYVWEGNSTIIDEVFATGIRPGVIVLAVGGGGLLCGVIHGLKRVGWEKVPVVAVEMTPTASLHASMQAREIVEVANFGRDSVCFLGPTKVARAALDSALSHAVTPRIVSEDEAIDACCRFTDDHHMVVEPVTGSVLATIYNNATLLEKYESVLLIVCGGNNITLEQLENMRRRL